jgi:hypothetical protein
MSILQVTALGLASFVLLQFWILPILYKRLDNPSPVLAFRTVGLTLAAQLLRSASLVVTATLGFVAAAIAWGPKLLVQGSPPDWAKAFEVVRAIRGAAERMDTGWGIAVLVILCVALWIALRREAKAKTQDATAAAVAVLQKQSDAGALKPLPPTEEMAQLSQMREHLLERAAAMVAAAEKAGNAADADPQKNAQLGELMRHIKLIDARSGYLDVVRRLDLTPSLQSLRQRPAGRAGRLGSFFISVGFIRSVSFGSRLLSIVSLAVLAPALVTLSAPTIAEAAEATSIQLHDLILADTEKQAEQQWRQSVPLAAQTQPVTAQDRALISQLGQRFQTVVQARNATLYRVGSAEAKSISASRFRQEILHDFASAHPGTTVLDANASQTEASAKVEAALQLARRTEHDFSGMRRQFEDALTIYASHADPRAWRAFSQKAKELLARVAAPMQSRDIAQMLFTELLNSTGGAVADAAGNGGLISELAGEYVAPGDVVEQAAKLRGLDTFTFLNAISGNSRDPVLSAGLGDGKVPLFVGPADEHIRELESQIQAAVNATASFVNESLPTLERSSTGIADVVGSKRELTDLLRTSHSPSRDRMRYGDALATFQDYFPGQVREEADTPRSEFLRGGGGPSLANSVTAEAESAGSFLRARNYGALRVFAKVGGVLLGLRPESPGGVSIVGLKWTDSPAGIIFVLTREDGTALQFGPFRAELIVRALAYAADGRPVATTMPQGLMVRRVLMHPAIVDSAIGCSMRHLDQFVDGFTSDSPTRALAETDVALHEQLYTYAWATQFASIEPKVAPIITRADVKKYLAELAQQVSDLLGDAAIRTQVEHTLKAGKHLNDKTVSPLTVKTDYFDQALVSDIIRCYAGTSAAGDFRSCIQSTPHPADYVRSMAWAVLPPQSTPESGVRERSYRVDRELSFLNLNAPGRDMLWPFDFVLELTFESPRSFSKDDKGSDREEIPFEFPRIHTWLNEQVMVGVLSEASSLDALQTLRDAREFTVLQRFFRLALDGDLGDRFPLEALKEIGMTRPHATPAVVRTPEWNIFSEQQLEAFKKRGLERTALSLGVARDAKQFADGGDKCPAILP